MGRLWLTSTTGEAARLVVTDILDAERVDATGDFERIVGVGTT